MKAELHFPPDYKTARANFVAAADASDLGTTNRIHPRARTRDGKALFLDTTTIGERDAKKALLLISESRDRGSETKFQQAMEAVTREGIEVFAAHYSAYSTTK